jgi:hypothetical protein
MSFEHAKLYLARVLHWPDANDEPAFANVHWTFRAQNADRPMWSGRAVRSVSEAIKALEFALKGSDTLDIYACLSTQRTAQEKVSQKGWKYLVPIRNQGNAVMLKSLFLDIDLKGGEHGYTSVDEAAAALAKFLAATGMPKPTMIVSSGGGFHVYWTLMRALTPAEWQPLAYALAEATKKHGLKCDTQCTVDCARVLRIPDTFNRKQGGARPVKIVGTVQDFDYSIERIEKSLAPYKNASLPTITPSLPCLAPLQAPSELEAGIDTSKVGPISIKNVLPECPFMVEALRTGGKDYTNPIWNMTTLLSTFCEDGRLLAHMMAKGHPGYSRESTDQLFDRKEREKAQKNLGWPSCASISAQGSKLCQTCPNFAKGKSPLNFGRPAPSPQMAPAPVNNDLPKGYARRPDGVVVAIIQNKESGVTEEYPICAFPMTNPWLERTADDYLLHFETKTDGGKASQICISTSSINTSEMRSILQGQGMMLYVGPKKTEAFGSFMSAWVTRLQETRESVQLASFGWTNDPKSRNIEGFVYGGSLWTPKGPKLASMRTGNVVKYYSPAGDIQKWIDAAKLITDQQRPALEAIVAASFGAPLVRFGGHTGVLLSAYSTESGIGKSTAMKVAQAIWGDPVRGIQMLDDTGNAAVGIMSELHSLPLLWDELKTEEDSRKMVNIVYRLTYGRDKNRMKSDTSLRDAKTFETLLISASNESLLEFAEQNMKTISDATFLRIFEYAVPPRDGVVGRIDPSRASRMVAELHSHYGNTGLEYAKWLGANHAKVNTEVGDFIEDLNSRIHAQDEERFWTTLIGVTCMGARYASQLGLMKFDEPALEGFMLDTLKELRDRRERRPQDLTKSINAVSVIEQYVSAQLGRHTLWTNRIHTGAGKPPANSIKVVRDASRLEGIHVHIGVEDKMLRIHNHHFRQWLADQGYPVHKTIQLLDAQFGFKSTTASLGSGTIYAAMPVQVRQIDMTGTELDFINA